MNQHKEELERPGEWLSRLREDSKLYGSLLDDAGSLALAAHRVASARCKISATAVAVPNGNELYAAAREIQDHVAVVVHVPRAVDLAGDCDAHGVPVLMACRTHSPWPV